MANKSTNIVLRDATIADVPSMSTMVPRSFRKDAFLLQIIPDTPRTCEWWVKTYLNALEDPAARLLVAVDDTKVVGLLTMHYLDPRTAPSANAGITTAIPLTPDHSMVLEKAFADLRREREELMHDEAHHLIELMGVDADYQKMRIGRRLVQWACAIADETDAAIYLQTSEAASYYTDRMPFDFHAMYHNETGRGGSIVRLCKSRRQDSQAPLSKQGAP